MADAYQHDEQRLPHTYVDPERLYPRAKAVEVIKEDEDLEPDDLEKRGLELGKAKGKSQGPLPVTLCMALYPLHTKRKELYPSAQLLLTTTSTRLGNGALLEKRGLKQKETTTTTVSASPSLAAGTPVSPSLAAGTLARPSLAARRPPAATTTTTTQEMWKLRSLTP